MKSLPLYVLKVDLNTFTYNMNFDAGYLENRKRLPVQEKRIILRTF